MSILINSKYFKDYDLPEDVEHIFAQRRPIGQTYGQRDDPPFITGSLNR